MNDRLNAILNDISVDEMWTHLEALCQWDRTTATEGEYAAVDYVADVLRGYGLPVEIHEYQAYISYPISASVHAKTADGDELEIRAKTRAFSATTPPEGAQGEVVSIIGGTNMFQADDAVNHISPETVGGKIVLSESGSRGSMLAAQAAGAAGYIHLWPSDEDVIHEGIVTPVWGTPTTENADRVPTIPIISIRHDDGVALRETMKQGPLHVTLHSKSDTAWRPVKMPVTEIPGRTDEFVLVAGHIDSWHIGTTDNATGNVACLELARVFHEHRDELHRGVRIAWWVGHSTGRYSGSTWYADQTWEELDRACVGYVNIDSPGALGATDYGTVSAVPETAEIVKASVRAVTGQDPEIERPMRAGDQSFWGIGVPSLYMLLSNRPEGQRAAVGGCGMGWWWHSEEDLMDKADRDVLLADTKIYAHSIATLALAADLPLDVDAQIAEILGFVDEIDAAAGEHFDMAPVRDVLHELRTTYGDTETSSSVTRDVNHRLTAISFTSDRFETDPAIPIPPLPSLDRARELPKLASGGDAYGFLRTELTRARNRVVHLVKEAIRTCTCATATP